jgi:hypothetical protein
MKTIKSMDIIKDATVNAMRSMHLSIQPFFAVHIELTQNGQTVLTTVPE